VGVGITAGVGGVGEGEGVGVGSVDSTGERMVREFPSLESDSSVLARGRGIGSGLAIFGELVDAARVGVGIVRVGVGAGV
jgi:hypothetical protein